MSIKMPSIMRFNKYMMPIYVVSLIAIVLCFLSEHSRKNNLDWYEEITKWAIVHFILSYTWIPIYIVYFDICSKIFEEEAIPPKRCSCLMLYSIYGVFIIHSWMATVFILKDLDCTIVVSASIILLILLLILKNEKFVLS